MNAINTFIKLATQARVAPDSGNASPAIHITITNTTQQTPEPAQVGITIDQVPEDQTQ